MKKIVSFLVIILFIVSLQSCTYQIYKPSTDLPLYADVYGSTIIYTVPVGQRVLMRHRRGNYCLVEYGSYRGWASWDHLNYIGHSSLRNYRSTYSSSYNTSTRGIATGSNSSGVKDVYVHGYYRTSKSGKRTYVHSYYRSRPGYGSSRSSSRSYGGHGRH